MCNFEDRIKKILLSNKDVQDIYDEIETETIKEEILQYLEDNNLGTDIKELGLKEEDLKNPKYMHDLEEEDYNILEELEEATEDFASNIQILYKYISDDYGSSNISSDSRDFCKSVVRRTTNSLLTRKDILALNSANPGFGKGGSNSYSVFKYRGGSYCVHFWIKFKFNKKTLTLVEIDDTHNQPFLG
mgnify:CR=1 FL=1|tara:strand:+ start:114 stop:677 length:564 start_codon:yes stop_codon:yes gene_type:complete